MTLAELLKALDQLAPAAQAEAWDNVGLMLGHPDREITSMLVALDASLEVAEAAVDGAYDLILTHHPLFFEPIKRLDLATPQGAVIATLIRHDIALVSLHTNLDQAYIVDHLGRRLGLNDIEHCGLWAWGRTEAPLSLPAFATRFATTGARLVDAGRPVARVGFCPGSGMSCWPEALVAGCDTLVTGDIRYHQAVDARAAGLNLIDLGHFGSEAPAVADFAAELARRFTQLRITAFAARDIFNPA